MVTVVVSFLPLNVFFQIFVCLGSEEKASSPNGGRKLDSIQYETVDFLSSYLPLIQHYQPRRVFCFVVKIPLSFSKFKTPPTSSGL